MVRLRSSTIWTACSLISRVYAQTSQGCYKDDNSLTSQGTYAYQSEGHCSVICTGLGQAVFAMSGGDECFCGNALPANTASSSLCNTACNGYPSDTCGGTGYYSVWLTGVGTLSNSAASAGVISSSTAASTSTSATTKRSEPTTPSSTTTAAAPVTPSVIYITTAGQQGVTIIQTVVQTPTATPTTSSAASSSSSASKQSKSSGGGGGISGGAIAGIVIGVLALAAIAAVLAFLLLRRRRRDSEDFGGEYKKHIEAVGPGALRSQPPSPDNRLDTSLAIRRNSTESFADNQDYSRKILRVVN